MAFDYKKEYKEFYLPPKKPGIIDVPEMKYVAVREAVEKKQKDFSKAEFFTYHEGLCVQCMHVGAYDDEPDTIRRMKEYAGEQGYEVDDPRVGNGQEERWEKGPEWEKNGRDAAPLLRCHHEIYLSDPRRTAPERLRTVIRQPVRLR